MPYVTVRRPDTLGVYGQIWTVGVSAGVSSTDFDFGIF